MAGNILIQGVTSMFASLSSCEGRAKDGSRFPAGMTARKATTTAKAEADSPQSWQNQKEQ